MGEVEHVVEAMADKTNDDAIDTVEDIVDSCLRHISKLQHKQGQAASSNHSSSGSKGKPQALEYIERVLVRNLETAALEKGYFRKVVQNLLV